MPFTASHPAAVLPLARRPLVPSALVVGAMVPDIVYYAPWLPFGPEETHAFSGVLTYNLVAGLVVLAIFHLLFKAPLLALAPQRWYARLAPAARGFAVRSARDVMWVVVSVALGAATHVGWDAFTHVHGAVVDQFPRMRRHVIWSVPFYGLLQNLSTLVGGAVLVWWVARWLRAAPVRVRPAGGVLPARIRQSVVAVVLAVAAAAALAGALTWSGSDGSAGGSGFDRARAVTASGAEWGVRAAVLALSAYSIGWHVARRRAADDDDRAPSSSAEL